MGDDEETAAEDVRAGGHGRMRLVLLVLAAVLVVAGAVTAVVVASGDGSEAGDSGGTSVAPPPPTVRPVALDAKPLWGTASGAALANVADVSLRGDLMLLRGRGARDEERLAVVDAATGTPRWALAYGDELPGGQGATWTTSYGSPGPRLVGSGQQAVVIVEYFRTACTHPTGFCPRSQTPSDEHGIAALSGVDGRVLWRTTVIPSVPAGSSPPKEQQSLADADDRIAVVSAHPGINKVDDPSKLRVVAVDVASGAVVWQQTGLWPRRVAAGTVLGRAGPVRNVGPSAAGPLGEGNIVALDASTGQQKWDGSGRLAASDVMLTAGDAALVMAVEHGARAITNLILDVRTGQELAKLTGSYSCDSDGTTTIACTTTSRGNALQTFRVDDRTMTVSRQEPPALFVDGIWTDRIFVSGVSQQDGSFIVDREANTIAEGLPGDFAAMSDRYAAFTIQAGKDGPTQLAVYRVLA